MDLEFQPVKYKGKKRIKQDRGRHFSDKSGEFLVDFVEEDISIVSS